MSKSYAILLEFRGLNLVCERNLDVPIYDHRWDEICCNTLIMMRHPRVTYSFEPFLLDPKCFILKDCQNCWKCLNI